MRTKTVWVVYEYLEGEYIINSIWENEEEAKTYVEKESFHIRGINGPEEQELILSSE